MDTKWIENRKRDTVVWTRIPADVDAILDQLIRQGSFRTKSDAIFHAVIQFIKSIKDRKKEKADE
jgi:Arc/MetJ-type ribon-helix-helix transcriptional regulator